MPEKVDIIISEPIGFLLVHERMLESYVVARDRFLKPNGLMMPTTGTLLKLLTHQHTHSLTPPGSIVIAPFTDDQIYKDQLNKISFWNCDNFYGVDLTHVFKQANVEYFSQPAVGTVSTLNHPLMHSLTHLLIHSLTRVRQSLLHYKQPPCHPHHRLQQSFMQRITKF